MAKSILIRRAAEILAASLLFVGLIGCGSDGNHYGNSRGPHVYMAVSPDGKESPVFESEAALKNWLGDRQSQFPDGTVLMSKQK